MRQQHSGFNDCTKALTAAALPGWIGNEGAGKRCQRAIADMFAHRPEFGKLTELCLGGVVINETVLHNWK